MIGIISGHSTAKVIFKWVPWCLSAYITISDIIDEYMMNVKLRPAPTRVNAILGCPYEMVRNGYYIPIFFC